MPESQQQTIAGLQAELEAERRNSAYWKRQAEKGDDRDRHAIQRVAHLHAIIRKFAEACVEEDPNEAEPYACLLCGCVATQREQIDHDEGCPMLDAEDTYGATEGLVEVLRLAVARADQVLATVEGMRDYPTERQTIIQHGELRDRARKVRRSMTHLLYVDGSLPQPTKQERAAHEELAKALVNTRWHKGDTPFWLGMCTLLALRCHDHAINLGVCPVCRQKIHPQIEYWKQHARDCILRRYELSFWLPPNAPAQEEGTQH